MRSRELKRLLLRVARPRAALGGASPPPARATAAHCPLSSPAPALRPRGTPPAPPAALLLPLREPTVPPGRARGCVRARAGAWGGLFGGPTRGPRQRAALSGALGGWADCLKLQDTAKRGPQFCGKRGSDYRKLAQLSQYLPCDTSAKRWRIHCAALARLPAPAHPARTPVAQGHAVPVTKGSRPRSTPRGGRFVESTTNKAPCRRAWHSPRRAQRRSARRRPPRRRRTRATGSRSPTASASRALWAPQVRARRKLRRQHSALRPASLTPPRTAAHPSSPPFPTMHWRVGRSAVAYFSARCLRRQCARGSVALGADRVPSRAPPNPSPPRTQAARWVLRRASR